METYRASSNSSRLSEKIFSFLYCSTNALRRLRRSNWSIIRLKSCVPAARYQRPKKAAGDGGETARTDATLVWLASMSPLTRWLVCTYGERRVSATWIDAGPQGMKFASCRSRMRRSD